MSAAPLESWTRNSLSRILAKTVSRYLKEEKHRREFEEWYFTTYGKKYIWKKRRLEHEDINAIHKDNK